MIPFDSSNGKPCQGKTYSEGLTLHFLKSQCFAIYSDKGMNLVLDSQQRVRIVPHRERGKISVLKAWGLLEIRDLLSRTIWNLYNMGPLKAERHYSFELNRTVSEQFGE